MRSQQLNYDSKNDVLYFVIAGGAEDHFLEIADGVLVEFDENDQPIGLEILNASKVIAKAIGRERLELALA